MIKEYDKMRLKTVKLYQYLNKTYKKKIFLLSGALLTLVGCDNLYYNFSEYEVEIIQYEELRNINFDFGISHVADFVAEILYQGEIILREHSLYRFSIWQIDPYDDEATELARQIDNILAEAAPFWLGDYENLVWTFDRPSLIYDNNRFISITTPIYFVMLAGRGAPYRHTVVIDIQRGERVFLDDLIDINDELIHLLQTGNIIRGIWNEFTGGGEEFLNEYISNLTHEEIRDFLMQTTIDPKDALHDRSIITTNTFHVEPGQLIISEHKGGIFWTEFIIYVEDIKDFLKVPAW